MNELPTIFGILVLACLTGLAIWRDSIPRQAGKIHWISWKPLYMISTVGLIVLLVHLANLYGIETGPDKMPRMR